MKQTSDIELVKIASEARCRAYAPYSGFKVGAALLVDSGEVFCGGNIENISFGLTICAERVALGSAVQGGASAIIKIVIFADSEQPIVPCGACRQVLAEFNADLPIVSATALGASRLFSLSELLPLPRQGILG